MVAAQCAPHEHISTGHTAVLRTSTEGSGCGGLNPGRGRRRNLRAAALQTDQKQRLRRTLGGAGL